MKIFPTIQELCIQLNDYDGIEGTPEAMAVRILTNLSELSFSEWLKINPGVCRWYDKCYRQWKKNGKLFIYPEMLPSQVDYPTLLKNVMASNPMMVRVVELLKINPAVPTKNLVDILKLEGYAIGASKTLVILKSMQSLLGWLYHEGFLNKSYFENTECQK